MAQVTVDVVDHNEFTVRVNNLQEPSSSYDKFVFRIIQAGKQIIIQENSSDSSSRSWGMHFYVDGYFGNDWLSPGCTYSAYVDCYYNGVAYSVGPKAFSTPSISPPSASDIQPRYWPTIRDQDAADNCVAQAVEEALEYVHGQRTVDKSLVENYSVSAIYGRDTVAEEGMYTDVAAQVAVDYGSPRWELVARTFPDNMSKADSITLAQSIGDLGNKNSAHQRLSGFSNIDFYDVEAIVRTLQNGGCVLFGFHYYRGFTKANRNNGIMQEPSGSSNDAHVMLIIGMTTINGKKHWIAINSWGENSGNGGVYYVPYDWGSGAVSWADETNAWPTSWTIDCYALYGSFSQCSHPGPPTITSIKKSDELTCADVEWTSGVGATGTLFLAREIGTEEWWPKPNYESIVQGNSTQIAFNQDANLYEIVAISVDDSGLLSRWSDITPTQLPTWSWESIGPVGGPYKASAKEWNEDFFNCINTVRRYKGLPNYDAMKENPAVAGRPMSIKTFYHAVWAISAMYPEAQRDAVIDYMLDSGKRDGLGNVIHIAAGDTICINQFTRLAEKLNALLV